MKTPTDSDRDLADKIMADLINHGANPVRIAEIIAQSRVVSDSAITDIEGLPANLPEPPQPPDGMRWVYQGKGFKRGKGTSIAYCCESSTKWHTDDDYADGGSIHYLEAVPIEPVKFPPLSIPGYWTCKTCNNLISPMETECLKCGTKSPSREPKDPYAELKAAHARGETIETKYPEEDESKWEAIDNPSFNSKTLLYRVKPAPKLVPLESKDLPDLFWVRECNGPALQALEVHYGGIFAGNKFFGWQALSEKCEYSEDRLNWHPCHKSK